MQSLPATAGLSKPDFPADRTRGAHCSLHQRLLLIARLARVQECYMPTVRSPLRAAPTCCIRTSDAKPILSASAMLKG